MIRVVNLDAGNGQDNLTSDQQVPGPLRQAGPDILCCQGVWRSVDGSEDQVRMLSESYGMPYSCFIAGPKQRGKAAGKEQGVSGLAILAGAGMWMLNSGSIPVISEATSAKNARIQFAIFRKNGTSVLVLNLQLGGSKQAKLLQLRILFLHPLLKEKFGAVVVCGDCQTGVTVKQLRTVTGGSGYGPHRSLMAEEYPFEQGMPWILTAKEQPVAAVTLCASDSEQTSGPGTPGLGSRQACFSLDFEMERIPQSLYNKSVLPMSFEEQWSGYKVKAAEVA